MNHTARETQRVRLTQSSSARSGQVALRALYVVLCLACLAAVFALQHFAIHTARGQSFDQNVMTALSEQTGTVASYLRRGLNTTVPVAVGVLVIVALIALFQRKMRTLTQVIVVFAGANLTAQLLKHVLIDRPTLVEHLGVYGNSFPSGHVTIAAAAAGVLFFSTSHRNVAGVLTALAGIWAVLIGIATVVSAWHRPSDVLGGFLIVAAWVFAAQALWGPAKSA